MNIYKYKNVFFFLKYIAEPKIDMEPTLYLPLSKTTSMPKHEKIKNKKIKVLAELQW